MGKTRNEDVAKIPSRVADKLHNSFCREDHAAMHCLYGASFRSPGAIADTQKWQGKARRVINFAKKRRLSPYSLVSLIAKLKIV